METTSAIRFWDLENFDPADHASWVPDVFFGIAPYVTQFLTSDHPYRPGKVCPFVPAALRGKRIQFAAGLGDAPYEDELAHMQACTRAFIEMRKTMKGFGALIVLYPEDFDDEELIDLQLDTKEDHVDDSIMIGALFPESEAPSLQSDEFFPMRTPTPALIVRDITVSDLVFMTPEHYSVRKRLTFLEAFIAQFEARGSAAFDDELGEARALVAGYKRKLLLCEVAKWGSAALGLGIVGAVAYWLLS